MAPAPASDFIEEGFIEEHFFESAGGFPSSKRRRVAVGRVRRRVDVMPVKRRANVEAVPRRAAVMHAE